MFYQNKLVLVTGGTGFVGTHIVEQLLKQGAKVRLPIHKRPLILKDKEIQTFPADLMQLKDCLKVCKGVNYIFHAAGAVAAAGLTSIDSMAAISTNLVLTAQMLQAAWAEGGRKIFTV
jgi:GDP-L-fucose synthase